MVLCTTCGDAVINREEGCPTCGDAAPLARRERPSARLDEALLDRVGDALAGQAALAQRTAADRIKHAADLQAQALVLRGRLRTQRALLRTLRSGGQAPPEVTDALERVERALVRPQPDELADARWQVRARLAPDATCATVARRLLRNYVSEELDADAGEDLILVASELVANAYVHGTGTITLHVARLADRMRLDVADQGLPRRIAIARRSLGTTGGRGLLILDRLALRWAAVPGTSHVWAELPLA